MHGAKHIATFYAVILFASAFDMTLVSKNYIRNIRVNTFVKFVFATCFIYFARNSAVKFG